MAGYAYPAIQAEETEPLYLSTENREYNTVTGIVICTYLLAHRHIKHLSTSLWGLIIDENAHITLQNVLYKDVLITHML